MNALVLFRLVLLNSPELYFEFLNPAPEKKISDVSKTQALPEQTKTNDSKGSATPTNSPGPSRINRVLTPVNQVTPVFKRFLDSTGILTQHCSSVFNFPVDRSFM